MHGLKKNLFFRSWSHKTWMCGSLFANSLNSVTLQLKVILFSHNLKSPTGFHQSQPSEKLALDERNSAKMENKTFTSCSSQMSCLIPRLVDGLCIPYYNLFGGDKSAVFRSFVLRPTQYKVD